MEKLSTAIGLLMQHLPTLVMIGLFTWIFVLYVHDRFQHKSTILRNYPVIGRARYWLEEMGEFFRQYWGALDRDELPFHRAERSWVYRAAKGLKNTLAFGSTRNPREGDVLFANAIFPYDKEGGANESTNWQVIGPHCRYPYATDRFFHISGMSYGALSKPAVKALAKGAKLGGVLINTGEGGITPWHLKANAHTIVQIGTAKYGMRQQDGSMDWDKLYDLGCHDQVKGFEIKLSQGAKPGKGGILPGNKVTPDIAQMRGIAVGQDSISPNAHAEIKCAGDLWLFIHEIRELTGKPVGFKLCIGNLEEFEALLQDLYDFAHERECQAIDSGHPVPEKGWLNDTLMRYAPDFITIDSGDGGTGAAPMPHLDATGLNIQQSLPGAVNILNQLHMRERIKVFASGKLITPVEVAWALCAGADAVFSGRGFLFSLGCIQAMQCSSNKCPTGITSHDRRYHKGLDPEDKAVRVMNYANQVHKEVEAIAHTCGVAGAQALSRKNALILVSNQQADSMERVYRPSPEH